MLQFFRRFLGSKAGAFIALAFLAIIAVAFAAGDITGNGGFSALTGGTGGNAAKAGSSTLSSSEVQSRVQRVFEQERRNNPGLQIGTFLSQNAVEQIFDQLVAGITVNEFGDDQGMTVSKRMIDAQIAAIPAFQDASGSFSQDLFRQLLSQQGVSEKALRDDIARELMGKQLVGPASLGVSLPDSLVLPYASLLLETRKGKVAAVPAEAFIPKGDPTDAQIKSYYATNAAKFTVPEQRRLRYAVIDASRFAGAAQPTDAEVAAYYSQNKAQYAASETRTLEQIIVPTQASAQGLLDQVKGGKTMAAVAQGAGVAVATLEKKSRDALTREASAAVAQAAFAAQEGAAIGPFRTGLGWAVVRVSGIERTAEKSLDAVRASIADTLRGQKEQRLLSDFTGKIEDQVAQGATFDEAVKDNALTVETTPFLLATGQSVQQITYQPPADVQPLLRPAFDMDAEDDAQLVPITADKRYALLDVGEIVAAAPPPLDEVRGVIVQQYKLSQGFAKAKAVADQIRDKVAKGTPLEQAVAQAGVPLPPIQEAGGQRAEIMRSGQRPPPAVAMLFTMPQGSVKTVPIGGDRGLFVVKLDSIARGDAGKQPALIDKVRGELAKVEGGEYTDQFERAIEKELGVKRDPQVVSKVKQELARANGAGQ